MKDDLSRAIDEACELADEMALFDAMVWRYGDDAWGLWREGVRS